MKTYEEIKAEIYANRDRIKELSSQYNALSYSEQIGTKGVTLLNKQSRAKIENQILHDNARQAYFSEVIPVIVEEIKKYVGKPCGDRTRKKIEDAIRERAGCSMYFARGKWYCITIVPLDDKGYSGTGMFSYNDFNIYVSGCNAENSILSEDNKIMDFNASLLRISDCADYVEDVAERAKKICEKFKAASAAWEVYKELASDFNELCPSRIEHIDYYKNPRYNLL